MSDLTATGYICIVYTLIYFTHFIILRFKIRQVVVNGKVIQGTILKYHRPYPFFLPLEHLYAAVKIRKGITLNSSLPISSVKYKSGENTSWLWFDKYPNIIIHKDSRPSPKIPPYETVCHLILFLVGVIIVL